MFAQLCEPCQSRRNASKTFDERYTIAIPLLKLVSDAAPCGNHAHVTCAILEVGIQFCLAYFGGLRDWDVIGIIITHRHSSLCYYLNKFRRAALPTRLTWASSAPWVRICTIYLNTLTYNIIYLAYTHTNAQVCVINISASVTRSHESHITWIFCT